MTNNTRGWLSDIASFSSSDDNSWSCDIISLGWMLRRTVGFVWVSWVLASDVEWCVYRERRPKGLVSSNGVGSLSGVTISWSWAFSSAASMNWRDSLLFALQTEEERLSLSSGLRSVSWVVVWCASFAGVAIWAIMMVWGGEWGGGAEMCDAAIADSAPRSEMVVSEESGTGGGVGG